MASNIFNDLQKYAQQKINDLQTFPEFSVFTKAYDFPKAPRTTNMVDRLMRPMDKYLFTSQYFHGSNDPAELSIMGSHPKFCAFKSLHHKKI